jgi:hypothetical protein
LGQPGKEFSVSAYSTIQKWLGENQPGSFFPPLDEIGHSVFVEGRESAVHLFVPAGEPREAGGAFYLYMPLVSLIGFRDGVLLEFMFDLGEANMVGALPTGYRFFYDRGQKLVYLGGQLSPDGLDGTAFRRLAEEFVRYGRLQGPLFSERLADLERFASGQEPRPVHGVGIEENYPPHLGGMIRI